MSTALPRLPADPLAPFPDPRGALRQPEGLLAIGGDLAPQRLLNAYRRGVFPWFSAGQPILWWSPDPRMVFHTCRFRLPARFRRTLRASPWIVRADTAFERVITRCADAPRRGQDGTWITPAMRAAYVRLHRLGHAHSIEVFDGPAPDATLVGGIYGVAVGRMFYGESMFSDASGGSKTALAGLVHLLRGWDWPLVDAQVENPHLLSLGAEAMERDRFLEAVEHQVSLAGRLGSWTASLGALPAAVLGR